MHTYMFVIHACLRAHTHTHTHAHTHTCAHTYTHKYTINFNKNSICIHSQHKYFNFINLANHNNYYITCHINYCHFIIGMHHPCYLHSHGMNFGRYVFYLVLVCTL